MRSNWEQGPGPGRKRIRMAGGWRRSPRPPVWVARRLACLAVLVATGACQSLGPATPRAAAEELPPTATSGENPAATTLPAASEAPTPAPTFASTPSPPSRPAAINPLTGLPVEDASVLQRRPIGIKVSNYPRSARPQAGLSYADLLFEFYQEAGDTRFHAIYLSREAPKVGPIRSGRNVDANLEKMYQSLLIFNAADYRVWEHFNLEDVRQFIIPEGPAPCPALCRDSSQPAINSLYANTAALRKAADALKIPNITPDLAGMVFDPAVPQEGTPATDVLVRFQTDNARAEWHYDPATQRYYRWSETSSGGMEPLRDRLNGDQISVSNLAVVLVTFYRPNAVEIYDVMLYGRGRAVFFRDGVAKEGSWLVANPNRPLQFFDSNGPYAFRPGQTWIALIGLNSTYTHTGDAWRFEFGFP